MIQVFNIFKQQSEEEGSLFFILLPIISIFAANPSPSAVQA
jgi:hypothetical protein